MRRRLLYLEAITDWHTRKVLSLRISNTLEVDFCVATLNEATHKFGSHEIMNRDQGSQFTSFVWTDMFRRSGVRISTDGEGRFLPSHGLQAHHFRTADNTFIERLWQTLKYESVTQHALGDRFGAKAGHLGMDDFLQPPAPSFRPRR